MPSFDSISIPKPSNWQDFERRSKILFECILNDSHAQLHGRGGQGQNGVDIYGRRNGSDGLVGVQCKGKDAGYGRKVTEKELRAEVEKTRTFTPALTEFFLITTAPHDKYIQEIARRITEEEKTSGRNMTVSVWGWEMLEVEIRQHKKALRAFFPGLFPYSDKLRLPFRTVEATGTLLFRNRRGVNRAGQDKILAALIANRALLACTRFRRHRVRCFLWDRR